MKIDELRQKNINELKKDLENSKKSLEKLLGEIVQRKEKNIRKVRLFRADIARISTVISEKRIISEEEGK